jgi:hypothetical protein
VSLENEFSKTLTALSNRKAFFEPQKQRYVPTVILYRNYSTMVLALRHDVMTCIPGNWHILAVKSLKGTRELGT